MPPESVPSTSGVRSAGWRVLILAVVYGLFFALGRWALDALFGYDPITYVSLGIAAAFGYLTGGLYHRGC